MLKKNIISIVALLVGSTAIVLHFANKKQQVVYADPELLFKGFNMTKEFEKKEAAVIDRYRSQLDTISKMIESAKNIGEIPAIEKQYVDLKQEYSTYYAASMDKINKAVWPRLNEYIMMYGKEHKINVLVGANGTGSLLYADEKLNITNALIEFINKKYEGK